MNIFSRKYETAKKLFKRQGWRGISKRLQRNYLESREYPTYRRWIRLCDTLTDADRNKIRKKISKMENSPLISVVMPVYNIEEKWLRRAIESVMSQLYGNWELCIADDNSTSPHVAEVLREYAKKDARIKVFFRQVNGHISAASNSALEMADGEFTAFLDHDDEIAETALYFVAKEIGSYPQAELIYSDEDKIDEKGKRFAPNFKPDYSPDLLLSLNLFTHLCVYRTKILQRINGFRIGTDGSQDYDLALRFTEEISAENIRHIPRILYHWRAISGSIALMSKEKPYAHESARAVLRESLERRNVKAAVSKVVSDYYRIRYDLPENPPKVSLITFLDENKECFDTLKKLISHTKYENFEMCLGTNSPAENSEITKKETKIKHIEVAENNAAAKFNDLAGKADGEILVFLDGSFVPQCSDWLGELVSLAIQKNVGVVGAKILNTDETVRNGGVILGLNNLFGFAHKGLPKEKMGNLARAQVINNFSAVSGILAARREVFESADGFDAKNFCNGLFDVDFCLRVGKKNLRSVFCPYAELIQYSISTTEKIMKRKNAPEVEIFRQKWKTIIRNDPFYNPNLSLKKESFSVAKSPRIEKI